VSIASFEQSVNDRQRAAQGKGLSTLLNTIGGGVSGFISGGPVGAVVGAGAGLAGSLIPKAPVKDIQSAMEAFKGWKALHPDKIIESITPDMANPLRYT
jgi:hypothetical protein